MSCWYLKSSGYMTPEPDFQELAHRNAIRAVEHGMPVCFVRKESELSDVRENVVEKRVYVPRPVYCDECRFLSDRGHFVPMLGIVNVSCKKLGHQFPAQDAPESSCSWGEAVSDELR